MTGGRTRAYGLFTLTVAEALTMLVGVAVVRLSFAAARDSFMISNAVIGLSCAACGLLIAAKRPHNPLGWLLLGAGVTQTGTAAVTPWLLQALRDGWADAPVRALATLYSAAWPWSVSLFLPLAVLFFPDGRLPGRWWRAAVLAAIVNAPLQVLLFSADPDPLHTVGELGPETYGRGVSLLQVATLDGGGWVRTASELVLAATYLAGLVGLVVRYRRGDERTRRQLLWLLLATTVVTTMIATSRLPGDVADTGFPIILTATVAMIPIAMAIAVLRHQLLDIRLVWSRAVTYALLTAGVVAVYLGLVDLADRLLRRQTGLGASVLATLLVAGAFNPVRVRLQRRVDRLLYGERADPVRAASSVTAHLAAGAERPADVLPSVCHALRLPYAALRGEAGLLGEHGVRPDAVERIPLTHGGELEVGVRSGQRRLDPADRAVLELMAVPIGIALRAGMLSDAVALSRRRIVEAREEERRRLRRDLHDGVGPVLTGIAFRAAAVVGLADGDRVRDLGEQIRTDVSGAITDVRRLIQHLRPSALDDVGLAEALRRHAERLDRRSDGSPLAVGVRADGDLPELPAAVEVAAYRIATEALTNVARHSCASRADVELASSRDGLLLTVSDDGSHSVAAWEPGIGLRSMHERAAELGGHVSAGPTATGGHVQARLPLAAP